MSIFLDQADIVKLTDKKRKSCQIAALRTMGIQFIVNASGQPVVTIKAIEGGKIEQAPQPWQSNALLE